MWHNRRGVLVLSGSALLLAAAQARPEPNAFLNQPAHTAKALVAQLERDPSVMSRYSRHFRMSPTELKSYLGSLRLARLDKPSVLTVYNVSGKEVIRRKVFEVKKGSYVWVDPHGRPVLKKTCGNALTDRPYDPPKISSTPVSLTREELRSLESDPTPGEPLELMTVEELLEPAFTPDMPNEPAEPEGVTPLEEEPGPVGPPPMPGGMVGGLGSLSVLPFVLVGQDTTRDRHTDPSAVPGPAAALGMLLPLGLKGLRRRRRQG